jgi:uncharacterized protein
VQVLLDTNVLISAILFGGVPRRLLSRALRGEIQLVTSPFLLDELEDLLAAKFAFSSAAARLIRSELEALSKIVEPVEVPEVCRDRDDDHVLAAAVAGAAEMLVTGDQDLLVLERHEGIRILTPSRFEQGDGRRGS